MMKNPGIGRPWQRRLGSIGRRRPVFFEELETRRVLAAVTWDGGGGDLLWSNAANWDRNGADELPQAGDNVTIQIAGSDPVIQLTSGVHTIGNLTSDEDIQILGGSLTITSSSVVNKGLTIDGGELHLTGGTSSGTGSIHNVSGSSLFRNVTLDVNLDNEALLTVNNTVTLHGTLTTTPSSVIRLEASDLNGSFLNVDNGFANQGVIELVHLGTRGDTSRLTVSNGVLENQVGATIRTLPGGGSGNHQLSTSLTNQGTLQVDHALLITNTGRTFDTSSGTINAGAGSQLTVSGGATRFGTATQLSGTDGQIDLAGTQVLELGSDFTYASGQPALTFGGAITVSGPGTFINQGALVVANETFNADLVNDSILTV
ncbi:MAG: hypothetical protein KDA60_17465, partial [Planctomycetales bacterium]|nr:hypothetical protein [Planctomycetales bacterium]